MKELMVSNDTLFIMVPTFYPSLSNHYRNNNDNDFDLDEEELPENVKKNVLISL